MKKKKSTSYLSIAHDQQEYGGSHELDTLVPDVENATRRIDNFDDRPLLRFWQRLVTYSAILIPPVNSKSNSARRILFTFYLLLFPLLMFFVGWIFSERIESVLYLKNGNLFGSRSNWVEDIDLAFSNEYGSATWAAQSGVNYPWSIVLEPYKLSYFAVTSKTANALLAKNHYFTSDVEYRWSIDGTFLDTGNNVSVAVPGPAGTERSVSLQIVSRSSGSVLREITQTVVVKYIRREIRALLAQDRVAFFQAVNVLQRVPTSVGQKLYGRNYYSKDYFTRIHLYFGSTRDCDRIHEGPGFISFHMSFSVMFEKALQSVNPSVALPYWDFTLESTFLKSSTFRSSVVFSDGWFSEADTTSTLASGVTPATSDHVVRKGRFAMTSVMEDARNYSLFVNPYGLLRSPWNSNPYPYLTRATSSYDLESDLKPSGCHDYAATLEKSDFISLAMALNTEAHGHIHELMGGTWGFQKALATPSKDAPQSYRNAAHQFSHFAEKYSKFLWRAGLMTCPDYLNDATVQATCRAVEVDATASRARNDAVDNPSTCRCQCAATFLSLTDEALPQLLYSLGVLKSLSWYDGRVKMRGITSFLNSQATGPALPIDGYTVAQSLEVYRDVRDAICDMGMIGDMFQASSPNDVTFWVLHPNMERLWHTKRLAVYYNLTTFDENWAAQSSQWTCAGHANTDPTALKNIFDTNDRIYTNEELYTNLHPARLALPYVYDTLSFAHCNAEGYDMKGY